MIIIHNANKIKQNHQKIGKTNKEKENSYLTKHKQHPKFISSKY